MVFGTFDGIHEGHLDFFRQAREYGDYLIAVAGRDVNIEKIKGRLPKYKDKERLEYLKKCPLVDKAMLGYKNDPYKRIEEVKPDVICIGYDQNSFNINLDTKLKELGLNADIYILKAHRPDQFKSSIINK